MISSVKDIIESLQKNYDLEETLVVTWWSKEDVAMNLGSDADEMTDEQIEHAWDRSNGDLDNALDDAIGEVNDRWMESLSDYAPDEEEEEEEED